MNVDLVAAARDLARQMGSDSSWPLAAVEFLRRYDGAESELYKGAKSELALAVLDHPDSGVAQQLIADTLDTWATLAALGVVGTAATLGPRLEAAIDLMEQVQLLLSDRDVHPAAPVMLAGAALEAMLRGLWEATTEPLAGSPSLTSYAEALRKAEMLDRNEVKDIIAIAGTRNDAAHGDFERVTIDRARLMADQVNLFMARRRQEADSKPSP
jgi:hypothetical protein